MTTNNRFNMKSHRRNLKYVPTALPKWPSIFFIDAYHSSMLLTVFVVENFVRFIHMSNLYFRRFTSLTCRCFDLLVNVAVNFCLICRFIVNDCGNARNVSLCIKREKTFLETINKTFFFFRFNYNRNCSENAVSSIKWSCCSISWVNCSISVSWLIRCWPSIE